ncbi:hypothetical protein RclHR1_09470007 [Rhizophagus clarus]|uniref:Uncharacterized protein n=1 Tax=Rhizophagus clarus TaxID=94130 RepID=A0A2Z6SQA6_9GLOM|nr:hypothetical protein RclHR1_09470007 [Rhizophagus clarus]
MKLTNKENEYDAKLLLGLYDSIPDEMNKYKPPLQKALEVMCEWRPSNFDNIPNKLQKDHDKKSSRLENSSMTEEELLRRLFSNIN